MTPPMAIRVGGLAAIAGALLAGHLSVPVTDPPSPPAHQPRPAAAPLDALDPAVRAADPGAVSARLIGPLANPALGDPAGLVVDALSGTVLLDRRSTALVAPASTLKMVVAAAALTTFDSRQTLRTRVVYAGADAGGPGQDGPHNTGSTTGPNRAPQDGGTIWLVGGGDPTLTAATGPASYPAPARLADLAAQVREAGITRVDRVVGDGTLFVGPSTAQGWRDSYVSDGNVTPLSALEVDGGRLSPGSIGPRTSTPDAAATGAFATALRRAGVQVAGTGTGAAPAGAREVAAVHSPPVPVLVERMLMESDNDLAESLGRLVAHARGLPASFAGATQAMLDVLRELQVPASGASLADASGLSTANQIAPATLVTLLRTAVQPEHPELRTLITGLPVAGFSGTLDERYHSPDSLSGAGAIRAKTGSLRIVTSLAGQLVDADGRLLLFGFFAPVEEGGAARTALDRVAVALASCGC